MNRKLAYLVLLAFLGPRLIAGECDHATPPQIDGVIVMDARNGLVTGPIEFKRGAATQFLLINKNPLRYQYTVDIKGKPVTEPAIDAFLALAGIKRTADPAAEPGTKTPPAGGDNAPSRSSSPCADEIANARDGDTALVKAMTALTDDVNRSIDDYDQVVAAVKEKREAAQRPDLLGPETCHAALELIDAAAFDLDAKSIKAKLKALDQAIDAQQKNVDDGTCLAKPVVASYRMNLKKAAKTLDTANEKLDDLVAAQKTLAEDARTVQAAIHKADAFWRSYPIGPYRGRTDVTVAVSGQDVTVEGAAAEPLRPEPLELNFGGGQRFFLSGGIVASVSDRKTYDAVDGFVLDRDGKLVLDSAGKPTLGKVVGVTEESDSRVAPAVLLHGLIWQPDSWCDGIGFALGVGSAGSDETLIEYFGGPTFSFIEHHLFVTVGAFRGVDETLGGDFYVGAEIPSTVTTLPKTERRTWTPGISISFRMP